MSVDVLRKNLESLKEKSKELRAQIEGSAPDFSVLTTINNSLSSVQTGNKQRLIEAEARSEFNRAKIKELLGKPDEKMVKELKAMKSIQDLINLVIIQTNLNHIQYFIDNKTDLTQDLKQQRTDLRFKQIIIGSIFTDTIQAIKNQIPCWSRGRITARLENLIAQICCGEAKLQEPFTIEKLMEPFN